MAIVSKYFLLFSNSNEWEYPKGQLISEWIFKVTVSPRIRTKNFCPHYTGQKSWNFLFVFWEKRWLHKLILKLTDLYIVQNITLTYFILRKLVKCQLFHELTGFFPRCMYEGITNGNTFLFFLFSFILASS